MYRKLTDQHIRSTQFGGGSIAVCGWGVQKPGKITRMLTVTNIVSCFS
jgi:hypothetical protein